MESENKKLYESAIQVKSGEYRFTVKDSPRSGRYLLIEDIRIKKGKTRTERVVLYPELMEGFDAEYQKAKAALSQSTVDSPQPAVEPTHERQSTADSPQPSVKPPDNN